MLTPKTTYHIDRCMSSKKTPNVLPLRQRPHIFLKVVRGLAERTENIRWSAHARERFLQRDINNTMATRVIRKGEISGDIVAGAKAGEWKAKLAYPIFGKREVGVVIILIGETTILVKTVEWED